GLIHSNPEAQTPDLQVMFVDVPLRAATLPGPAFGEGYTLATSLMLPGSRGSVRLASAEPGAPPLIDPNYYADQRDLEVFIAGLRAAREIGRAAALDQWRGEEVLPGPDVNDDASLRAYLRRNISTYAHPGGTCRIGTDGEAVVDTELRVRGMSGLRVADASVMPSAPSANTNATVYAIAERAADLILTRSRSAAPPFRAA
ncbi:MAG TPA: GMC oxidoreductase, partial [Streptosporangiaceae bacterium]